MKTGNRYRHKSVTAADGLVMRQAQLRDTGRYEDVAVPVTGRGLV
jgi:hypothetical protein